VEPTYDTEVVGVPRPWRVYRHFKGRFYLVTGSAFNTETGEMDVIYSPLYDSEHASFSQSVSRFREVVLWPDGKMKPRFDIAAVLQEAQFLIDARCHHILDIARKWHE